MAKTIQQSRARWERKTADAGEKWKRGTSGAGSAYARGVGEFLGTAPSGRVVSAYDAGVNSVSAADFQQSVAGKGQKWEENLRRGLTG